MKSALQSLITACVVALSPVAPILAQDTNDAVRLKIQWYPTMSEDALVHTRIFLAIHNGQFDSYDFDKPLSDFVSHWMASSFSEEMIPAFLDTYPNTQADWIWNPPMTNVGYPGGLPPPWRTTVTVDPTKHRFLSYLSRLHPSNDAFIGNEDPFEIELFDHNGKFMGPLFVDVYGNRVVDAGLCVNDEQNLSGIDHSGRILSCPESEGVARLHPGFNGSHRNPDGLPQRILGGETLYHPPSSDLHLAYDPINADFSRPGYRIGRLRVTRWAATGNWSGSWYSPERAGEGFNVELVEPAPGEARTRILVYWYTFKPDGSGEQVWLAGMGELDADDGVAADVEMYLTTGGEFTSTSNPDLVDRERWGTIRIGFGDCASGRVFYQPDDPDWPSGDYYINRLSPQIEGLGWVCQRTPDARLILPED
jgi:hypothetical protein